MLHLHLFDAGVDVEPGRLEAAVVHRIIAEVLNLAAVVGRAVDGPRQLHLVHQLFACLLVGYPAHQRLDVHLGLQAPVLPLAECLYNQSLEPHGVVCILHVGVDLEPCCGLAVFVASAVAEVHDLALVVVPGVTLLVGIDALQPHGQKLDGVEFLVERLLVVINGYHASLGGVKLGLGCGQIPLEVLLVHVHHHVVTEELVETVVAQGANARVFRSVEFFRQTTNVQEFVQLIDGYSQICSKSPCCILRGTRSQWSHS